MIRILKGKKVLWIALVCMLVAAAPLAALAGGDGDKPDVTSASIEETQTAGEAKAPEAEESQTQDEAKDSLVKNESKSEEGDGTSPKGPQANSGGAIQPLLATDDATLRADILAAPPGGTVDIANSITILGTPLVVDKNLTFRSTGGAINLTVNGAFRHITTSNSIAVTFDGVSLVGSSPAVGGGIESNSVNLTLNNAIINSCVAPQGGGVLAAGGSLTMNGGVISNNTASVNFGGGVHLGGTFTMNSGVIRDNSSVYDGGGVSTYGPAILSGGTISGNTSGLDGGGVSALDVTIGTLSTPGATVTGNTAAEHGGGIFAQTVTLNSGEISNNVATTMYGGGIHVEQGLAINGGVVRGNRAVDGGGISFVDGLATGLTINGGLITQNVASRDGGGIDGDTMEMHGGTVSYNVAGRDGGGLYADHFTLNDAVIEGNEATGDGGGVLCGGTLTMNRGSVRNNTAGFDGGGVVAYAPNSVINDGDITGNDAGRDGGGIYGSIINIVGGRVANNSAGEVGGGVFDTLATIHRGVVTGNVSGENGGGIHAELGITVNGGEVSNNVSVNGGGLESFGPIALNSGMVSGNVAHQDGGGIYGFDLSDITVGALATFSNNKAARAYQIKPSDIALYNANVHTSQITKPFEYAYNNFDINYEGDTLLYVVEFDSRGGSEVDPIAVPAGELVAKPANPTRSGYTFTGWFKNAGATNAWNFEQDAVNANVTLYAGWKKNPTPPTPPEPTVTPTPDTTPTPGGSGPRTSDASTLVPLLGMGVSALAAVGFVRRKK